MPEHKPYLPPQIGKWLASDNPALREKAEAALRAAEPDANDLLLEQIKKERQNHLMLGVCAFTSWQFVYMFATRTGKAVLPTPHGFLSEAVYTLIPFALSIPFALLLMFWATRAFVLPAGARYAAVLLKLAQRGDVRAVPLLLASWLEPSPVASDRQADIENALTAFFQNTAPGSLSVSENPKAKDPVAHFRAKFTKMTRKEKGVVYFSKAATLNARRIQVWLALLPHLAADTNPKNQAVLAGLLDAQARTLEEELLQNTVRALLDDTAETAQPSVTAAAAPTDAWKPTKTHETPTLLQRLGRR